MDEKPELSFRLIAVNENELFTNLDTALPLSKKPPAAGRVLDEKDVAELFGLDIDGARDGFAKPKKESAKKPQSRPEDDGPRRSVE